MCSPGFGRVSSAAAMQQLPASEDLGPDVSPTSEAGADWEVTYGVPADAALF